MGQGLCFVPRNPDGTRSKSVAPFSFGWKSAGKVFPRPRPSNPAAPQMNHPKGRRAKWLTESEQATWPPVSSRDRPPLRSTASAPGGERPRRSGCRRNSAKDHSSRQCGANPARQRPVAAEGVACPSQDYPQGIGALSKKRLAPNGWKESEKGRADFYFLLWRNDHKIVGRQVADIQSGNCGRSTWGGSIRIVGEESGFCIKDKLSITAGSNPSRVRNKTATI